jgi:hypothetical protein
VPIELLDRLRYADPKVKKKILLGVVAAVLFGAAGLLFARLLLPSPPEQADVPGMRRASQAEQEAAQAAREERERETERLRREMEEEGVDPEANPRSAEISEGGG